MKLADGWGNEVAKFSHVLQLSSVYLGRPERANKAARVRLSRSCENGNRSASRTES